MIERFTFLLAMGAFALLAVGAVLASRRVHLLLLATWTAAPATAHVYLVWAHRYKFSFAEATRNGYIGFVLFHTALTALIAAIFAPPKMACRLTLIAFLAVSIGANGAVFRYDVVAAYRIPVVVCTVAGLSLIVLAMLGRGKASSNG